MDSELPFAAQGRDDRYADKVAVRGNARKVCFRPNPDFYLSWFTRRYGPSKQKFPTNDHYNLRFKLQLACVVSDVSERMATADENPDFSMASFLVVVCICLESRSPLSRPSNEMTRNVKGTAIS